MSCRYEIDVNGDLSSISIVFNDFDLESVGINDYDTLQYGMGTSIYNNPSGEFTGSDIPPAFVLETSSAVWFKFTSDINNFKEHIGFSLDYKIGNIK